MKTKPGFNIRNVCGQDLIVAEGEENIDFSSIISMNETSSYLWKAVQKMDNFTVDDMVNIILEEYDTTHDRAFKDCEMLAAQWAQVGIIEGDDIPKIEVNAIETVGPKPSSLEMDVDSGADAVKNADNGKSKSHSLFGRLFHKK